MLLIDTNRTSERQQLQSQFQTENSLISVPQKCSESIQQLIKAITYENFHNNPPLLAMKIQEYIVKSLKMIHSLQLYRDILQIIKVQQQNENQYKAYFLEVNEILNGGEQLIMQINSKVEPQSCNQLFQQALKGESQVIEKLEDVDMPFLYLESLKLEKKQPQSETNTDITNSTVKIIKQNKQTLGSFNSLSNLFYSASAIYSREDWKTDRKKEDSTSIECYQKKSGGIIEKNGNLKDLIINEFVYDLNREKCNNLSIAKTQNSDLSKYNKKIKEALFFTKIGPRKK